MLKKYIISVSDNLSDIWKMRKRGARDAARHKERLRKAAKDNLKEIISQEDIISKDPSGRKIKVPIKYLDQWHFKNGKNRKSQGVGQGGKDFDPGDILGREPGEGSGKAGDNAGDVIYEEFDMDEVVNMMMEDLQLPWLEEKPEQTEIESDAVVYEDIAKRGLMPNLDIRRTLKENIKRNAAAGNAKVGDFKQDDLRYKTYDNKKEYHSNAAVYLVMDRSGSMTTDKKYIAKSFFFWLVQFIKRKYSKVELVFIAHDTEARVCEEKNFFEIAEGGGTKCSSGFKLALEHINQYHNPDRWNNYVFAFSDGDNYDQDNELCTEIVKELLTRVNAIGYGEITIDQYFYGGGSEVSVSTLQSVLKSKIESNKFISVSINKREDVYNCLKKFLGLKEEEKK